MEKSLYCPKCEAERVFRFSERNETLDVRGEKVSLSVPTWTCSVCGELVADEAFGDPVEKAYDLYRRKHGLLSPAEIKAIRERWGLSQVAFATLLGMSQATINRYEQGAIQQQKEDELIRACANADRMRDLLQRQGHLLSERQKQLADAALSAAPAPAVNWAAMFGGAMPVEMTARSGFRPFDFERYAAAVVWLCSYVPTVTQTKLYKLLFYADYLCFRTTSRSLTGALYRRMPYGPVPMGFSDLRARLECEDFVLINEMTYQNGNTGEEFRPGPRAGEIKVDFTVDELRVLTFVKDQLGSLPPSAIRNKSHEETAWKNTPEKAVISYEMAQELSLALPASR